MQCHVQAEKEPKLGEKTLFFENADRDLAQMCILSIFKQQQQQPWNVRTYDDWHTNRWISENSVSDQERLCQ